MLMERVGLMGSLLNSKKAIAWGFFLKISKCILCEIISCKD
jgi:hypothetical protein